jgi:acetylornithine deacetylase/succinyl-diaminopimelate desuccinylase-like protein
VRAEVRKRNDESVKRLQDWIRLPTIAAERRSVDEGCQYMMELARDAGFGGVARVETKGLPSVFGTLDAGAPRTVGLYFMLDVKQADPAEWSSPPFEARIVQAASAGGGPGAVNQNNEAASPSFGKRPGRDRRCPEPGADRGE